MRRTTCKQTASAGYLVMDRSPTPALLFGLLITMVTVVAYSCYITLQIGGLKSVQRDFAAKNRKDSLQLLRVQNDLNSLGLAMRDMLDDSGSYPLTAWSTQFYRIHKDMDDALRLDSQLAADHRTPAQREYLGSSLVQFWNATDRMFSLALETRETEARDQIRVSLLARQQALTTAVARLLIANTESEEQTALYVNQIYDRVQRQAYLFLAGALVAILLTGLYLTYSNRRLFDRLTVLAGQRSDLAQKLISTQESTLRHISRELHDEFGQILTAIGAMLSRMHKQSQAEPPLFEKLLEIREIVKTTLEKVRCLSQALHPVILDEADLVTALEWYLPHLQRQTGLDIKFEKSGVAFQLESRVRIHIYRVAQEGLSNVLRHSGASQAWVRLEYRAGSLLLEVEDHGTGIVARAPHLGIGMVAMSERATLLGGTVEFLKPAKGGTLVRLTLPRAAVEISPEEQSSLPSSPEITETTEVRTPR